MRTIVSSLAVLGLLSRFAIPAAVAAEPRSATFEVRHELKVTIPGKAGRIQVWFAMPQSDPLQEVSDFKVQAPVHHEIKTDSDVVRVLREELHFLLEAGVTLVQFDEPVLSEVVFTGAKTQRSFMCGALSEKNSPEQELGFATRLINAVIDGLPSDRVGLHICRGNWTRDESAALRGDYSPLLGLLKDIKAGNLFLELCTPRAGELETLKRIPDDRRIGVGVVNQKLDRIESVAEIVAKAQSAINLFGKERVYLTPDCGFATFADNPVNSAAIAEQKLKAIVEARDRLI